MIVDYYGQFALQHEAMERFEEKFGGNYWQDVAEIHVKLGLLSLSSPGLTLFQDWVVRLEVLMSLLP